MVPPCPRPLLAVTRTAANAGPRWNWEPHPLAEDLPRPYVRCTRTRPVPSRWTRPHPGGAIDGTSPFRPPLEDTGRRTPVARVPCTDRSPVICDTAGAAVHLGERLFTSPTTPAAGRGAARRDLASRAPPPRAITATRRGDRIACPSRSSGPVSSRRVAVRRLTHGSRRGSSWRHYPRRPGPTRIALDARRTADQATKRRPP
jgi:hypothetical protein